MYLGLFPNPWKFSKNFLTNIYLLLARMKHPDLVPTYQRSIIPFHKAYKTIFMNRSMNKSPFHKALEKKLTKND